MLGLMKGLMRRIYDCRKCKAFEMILIDKPKPCLEFKIHDGLKDREVEAVFFAESPPPEGYFYDERRFRKGSLREGLLSLLGITIKGFKERYFLTDSLKCRVRKNGDIRNRQTENCLPILKEEIELFKEMGIRKIVLLGEIALKAFQMIEFQTLKGRSIKRDCGKIVEEAGLALFIGALPFPWNKRYWDKKTKNRLRDFLGTST